jgi:ribosomal protein S2
VIPGNDDAIRSCSLIVRAISEAIEAGKSGIAVEEFERNGQKEPETSETGEEAPPAADETAVEPEPTAQDETPAEPEPTAQDETPAETEAAEATPEPVEATSEEGEGQ